MHYILDDYLNYCQADGLITTSDAWKYMRVNPVGRTFEFCIKNNLYYCYADKSFKPHAYIGLYTNKSVRAIGKIHAIITANKTEDGIDYTVEQGELTDELKLKIESAIANKAENGWFESCRYFFVEEFFSTDFKKITPRGLWGVKIFDLTQIFEVDKMPETKVLAEGLKKKTWG
jgi:hypothetical protein